MAEFSDDELLDMMRRGENPNYAFNLLVRKYQERVYFFVRRMVLDHDDADDVVQNIFIKVWQNLHTFRNDSKLFTWIYRIAMNETISFLKGRKLRAMLLLRSAEAGMLHSLVDGHFFNGDEIQKKLQAAILKLPTRQRLVFNMRYYEELSYEEMSEILGTSVGALKASYHIAMKKVSDSVTNH